MFVKIELQLKKKGHEFVSVCLYMSVSVSLPTLLVTGVML